MSEQHQAIHLKDYQVPDFIIEKVHLHVELDEVVTTVRCLLDVQRNPESTDQSAPLKLNGEKLELTKVALDGQVLNTDAYQVDAHYLTIPSVPEKFRLETEVNIRPQDNKALMGLYKSRNNYCTQCESQGFRRITYYLDRPDVLSRFTTTISADKTRYPYLLSNGNLIETRDLDNNRHWVKWHDPSLKPCYLFALVAGDFDLLEDSFDTMNQRTVKLQLYLEKGFGEQGGYALECLKNAMKWDEERWGREYDLDMYMIVAVSDFNMGAMENKGLNVFNTKYVLADPASATDTDYIGIEAVIGHEYFHNWSGNRVTCRDWFQITLKEGLTVFRDQCFTEDMNSKAVSRLDVVDIVRNRQFMEDSGPLSHPIRPQSYIEINNFYTLTVYRKGSEVIRMVETLLGRDEFRRGLDLYFDRHDGQAVTTDDFIQAMQDASQHDLTQFKHWYDQAGTPTIEVNSEYNADEKSFTLSVQQGDSPFYFPLTVGLVGEQSQKAVPLQLEDEGTVHQDSKVLVVNQSKQTFTFVNVEERPIPSLLRNFSAPVRLHYPYTDAELVWLVKYDTDAFARWDAGQQLACRVIMHLVEGIQQGWPMALDSSLVDVFKVLLTQPVSDKQYLSRLLTLPTENYMHMMQEAADVHATYKARRFVKQQLAKALEAVFLETYKDNVYHGPYEFTPEAVGQRQLKAVCLSYLVCLEKEAYIKLAYEQYTQSNNMSDTMSALRALNQVDCAERELALHDFYKNWQHDPLVMNKWLTLQATTDIPNAYEKVLDLLTHEAFDIENPNNVYALLCAFGENHTHFHDETGKGYEFIAEQVLKLDQKNPQVAARVIMPLTRWKQYHGRHAELMKQALRKISETPGLSKDIYEVVSKSLET